MSLPLGEETDGGRAARVRWKRRLFLSPEIFQDGGFISKCERAGCCDMPRKKEAVRRGGSYTDI